MTDFNPSCPSTFLFYVDVINVWLLINIQYGNYKTGKDNEVSANMAIFTNFVFGQFDEKSFSRILLENYLVAKFTKFNSRKNSRFLNRGNQVSVNTYF